MHEFAIVVTEFMNRFHYAEVMCDGTAGRRLLGSEVFRTGPMQAEEFTAVRNSLLEKARAMARERHIKPDNVAWP